MLGMLPARFSGAQQINCLDRMAEVRDHDTSTNNQRHIETVVELVIVPASIDTLLQVVVDAVIATQHCRCDQAEHFLGFAVKRTVFVGGAIQPEETLDAGVIDVANTFVHALAVQLKLIKTTAHSTARAFLHAKTRAWTRVAYRSA
jgi:hypothetical protein